MIVTQYVKTIFPQTNLGQKKASEMEQKLREQGFIVSRNEDTQAIILDYEARFEIEDES